MSTPKWNEVSASPAGPEGTGGSSKAPGMGCWWWNGATGQPYADAPAGASSAAASRDSIALKPTTVRPDRSIDPVKLLLVTLNFPPAGGGGVQRPLKFASHLPALGIETHVLAPDDPKWVHEDADLPLPTQAWIHRARYVGPRGRRVADEQHGRSGVELRLVGG